jgi:hypothetical protein
MKRLYVVRVIREAYVLASSAIAALELQSSIERHEDAQLDVDDYERLDGWTDSCLVYNEDAEDITLGKAKAIHATTLEFAP